MKMRSN